MKSDFAVYNKIYAEYFTDVQACRTTVEVKSLPTPIAIELKVIGLNLVQKIERLKRYVCSLRIQLNLPGRWMKKDSLKISKSILYPPHQWKGKHLLTKQFTGLQPKSTQDYILNELEDWVLWRGRTFSCTNHGCLIMKCLQRRLQNSQGPCPKKLVAMNSSRLTSICWW